MFVDGVRQVRARFPNGNPQDNSGICFSSTNRPGEGCEGYLSAEGAYGGSLPGSRAVKTVSMGPNRGNSPTLGCPQCSGSVSCSSCQPFRIHPLTAPLVVVS